MQSIINWLRNSELAYALMGPPTVDLVENAHTRVAGTPDEWIANAILQSIALNPDQWDFSNFSTPQRAYENHYTHSATIYNATKTTSVTVGAVHSRDYVAGNFISNYKWSSKKVEVNKVPLAEGPAKFMLEGIIKWLKEKKAAEAAARKAQLEMEQNELKWNIAENLLGMKRNENGALVPVNTAENKS